MDSTSLTAKQKAILTDAVERRKTGNISTKQSPYTAPTVKPVDIAGVLDPTVNANVVKIVINSSLIRPPQILRFYWDGDTDSIPAVEVGTQPQEIAVPADLVIKSAYEARKIYVAYLVTDDDSPEGEASGVLELPLKKYVVPVYPQPVITEASNGELDVSALTADANLVVAAWAQQAAGQKLWLTVTSNPPIVLQNKWRPVEVPASGPLSRKLAKAQLQTLKDGSTLTLKLEIGADEQHLSPFSEVSYAVKAVPDITSITIDRVTDSKGVDIPNGSTTTDTSVTIYGSVA